MPALNMRNFALVVAEYEAAAWGEKQEILAARLPLMQMSEGTFHRRRRQLFGGNGRKAPATKGRRKKPEYEAAVREIIKLKHSTIRGVRQLTTEDAMEMAADAGLELARVIPKGTVDRIARELGLHATVKRRENRFEAERPNQLHQMDASRSEYFQCYRLVGNEWTIKLSPTIFKNREYQEHRKRVWLYGLVDDFSGLRVMRYYVDKGENHLTAIAFLQWAWSRTEEHAPFRGLPETLYLDKGPLDKTLAFQEFCREVAKVRLLSHEAGRAQATGKVETGWKDLWRRFEARFFRQPGWEGREFSLQELNQELFWYLKERHNQRQHRRLPITKEEAWLTARNVADIEPEAWRHIFYRDERTLDAAGCFDFRGEPFQVRQMPYPGGVRCEVLRGLRDGSFQVIDPRDGTKYLAGPFQAAPAGEFRSGAHTPLEQLLKEEAPAGPAVTFAPGEMSKVSRLVPRGEMRRAPEEAPLTPALSPQGEKEKSLEELARGVSLIERDEGEGEGLLATVHERRQLLMGRVIRGEVLTGEERDFMAWYEEQYREVLPLIDRDEGPRLAVVE
jgi:hypothetical protein